MCAHAHAHAHTHNLPTHNLLTHNLFTHNLPTTTFSHTNLLTHTHAHTHNLPTHNLLTRNLLTHTHTIYSHTTYPTHTHTNLLTHHLPTRFTHHLLTLFTHHLLTQQLLHTPLCVAGVALGDMHVHFGLGEALMALAWLWWRVWFPFGAVVAAAVRGGALVMRPLLLQGKDYEGLAMLPYARPFLWKRRSCRPGKTARLAEIVRSRTS